MNRKSSMTFGGGVISFKNGRTFSRDLGLLDSRASNLNTAVIGSS